MNWSPPGFGTEYAAAYDAERADKPGWELEYRAVATWLKYGPVLDCPVGTGRFIPLYLKRQLDFTGLDTSEAMLAVCRSRYPDARVEIGDMLALPSGRLWSTLVCMRLLPWLSPAQMARALSEAGRVAERAIVSVRIGKAGGRCRRGSLTHSWDGFKQAVEDGGLKLEGVRQTADTEVGTFLVTRLERAP